MDIQYPIASVISSLEGPALVALDRTTHPLSLGEIHRLVARGSRSGLQKALVRLSQSGVVITTGKPPRYELNREHLAYPAVAMLTQLRSKLFERINTLVTGWDTSPQLVGVFGSAARGDGDDGSDIDLLVVGDPSDKQIGQMATAVEGWTGNHAQIVSLSAQELADLRANSEPIVASWDADLVIVFGEATQLREVG